MWIVFEGADGVGKTTQIHRLAKNIQQENPDQTIVCTKEPGGSNVGTAIREIFQNPDFTIDANTELYLILASRYHHVANIVQTALADRKIVLCDRFLDSTFVYQGVLGNINHEVITKHHTELLETSCPNLVIYLLYRNVETILSRLENRGARDRKERQIDTNTLNQINEFYKNITHKYFHEILYPTYPIQQNKPQYVQIYIDGLQENQVASQVWDAVQMYIKNKQ
jgi:dTMP kinase